MEDLQAGSLRFGASRPDNVAVVEERENIRFKEKKKRLRKKLRETAKKIDVAGHLGTDRVTVVGYVSVSLIVTSRSLKNEPVQPYYLRHLAPGCCQ